MNSLDWHKVGFAVACVVTPIFWGWLMHRLFVWLDLRRSASRGAPPPEHDYEI